MKTHPKHLGRGHCNLGRKTSQLQMEAKVSLPSQPVLANSHLPSNNPPLRAPLSFQTIRFPGIPSTSNSLTHPVCKFTSLKTISLFFCLL